MSQYFASIFRRRPNEGWMRVGKHDATTVDIICAIALATMFFYGLFGRASWLNLVYSPIPVRLDLELWRVVTWSTATQPDLWPLLGIVFFWSFGQDVEALMGRTRFLTWFLALTIIPAVVMTPLAALSDDLDFTTLAAGLQLVFLGAIWVYAATYPQVRWFEVVPLWGLAAGFTVLNLLSYNGNEQRGMVVFTLLAVATALVAGRSLGVATGWPIPHLKLPSTTPKRRSSGPTRNHRPKRQRGVSRQSETVVEGPWSAPSSPASSPGAAAAQAELDVLLDKISDSGLDSLSSEEKQRLNELSKRLR